MAKVPFSITIPVEFDIMAPPTTTAKAPEHLFAEPDYDGKFVKVRYDDPNATSTALVFFDYTGQFAPGLTYDLETRSIMALAGTVVRFGIKVANGDVSPAVAFRVPEGTVHEDTVTEPTVPLTRKEHLEEALGEVIEPGTNVVLVHDATDLFVVNGDGTIQ